jgi:cytidylate kinase
MNSEKNSDRMIPYQNYIIAIDGYSSCGKSTFARMIAKELDFVYIDSGAMYRAVALYCIENGLLISDNLNTESLLDSLDNITIRFIQNEKTGMQETWLNNRNVELEIRGIRVSSVVSKISQVREVRAKMVKLQREIGKNGNVVMDGRDIGTVVFPAAQMKIFMTADKDVRASRRYKELLEKGTDVMLDDVRANILMRDHEDENRQESPLRKAPDSIILDNSQMTVDQQMDWFRELWNLTTCRYDH